MHFNTNYKIWALCLAVFILCPIAIANTLNKNQRHHLFNEAVTLLEESNRAERESGEEIVQANKVRKELNKLRSQIRKIKDTTEKKNLTKEANKLIAKLKKSQADGSQLREKNKELFKKSLEVFEEAVVESWGEKIRNRRPVSMDTATTSFISHNTRFRSVHPKMLNKMGTPTENIDPKKVNKEMSLLIPALAGQNAPPDLDISSFQISREQQYFAHIEVASATTSTTDTQELLAPLNQIHKWHLILSDLAGNPIKNADIEIVGHMPGHVHGLPTQPRVTEEIEPGIYKVEGVKFQMKGWWVMKFNVANAKSDKQSDSVVFNLVF